MSDTISRQDAINGIYKEFKTVYCWNCDNQDTDYCEDCHRKYMQWSASKETVESVINGLPSADPNAIQRIQRVGSVDLISRQAVLDFPIRIDHYDEEHGNLDFVLGIESVMEYVESLPSAEPKTGKCESCKRSSDYCSTTDEDKTRCPIEEHYALPKDGYCHLYEQI